MAAQLGAHQVDQRVGNRAVRRGPDIVEGRQGHGERPGANGWWHERDADHGGCADHDATGREHRRADEIADDLGPAPDMAKPPGV